MRTPQGSFLGVRHLAGQTSGHLLPRRDRVEHPLFSLRLHRLCASQGASGMARTRVRVLVTGGARLRRQLGCENLVNRPYVRKAIGPNLLRKGVGEISHISDDTCRLIFDVLGLVLIVVRLSIVRFLVTVPVNT